MYSSVRVGLGKAHSTLALLALACGLFSQAVHADTGTVTVTMSYLGTWGTFSIQEQANLNYSSCPPAANEQQVKNCLDTTANTGGNTVDVPWIDSGGDLSQELWIAGTEAPFSDSIAEIIMNCPNGGSPNPTLDGSQGAGPVPGWCLILGIAPPPAPPYIPPLIPAGKPDPAQTAGDPIDAGSGNMYYETTDYEAAGDLPVLFTRSYNSNIANQSTAVPGADQTLGIGWTSNLTGSHLNFNVTQEFYTCQYPDGSGNPVNYICPTATFPLSVTLWRQDGSQAIFTGEMGNNSESPTTTIFTPQPGVTDQLSFGPLPSWVDGELNTLVQAGKNGFTNLRSDGSVEYYSATGLLLTVRNPHRSAVFFYYDANNRLIRVQGSWYSTLNVTYDTSGRIKTIGGCTYSYDAAGNLSQVTYADNTAVTYLYEDTNHPHALTGVIDEKANRYTTWSYDALGRAISSQHAGGVDAFTINSYSVDSSNDIISAVVTEPTGLQRNLTFILINGINHLASVSGPCTECGDKRKTISYDSATRFVQSETDFNGNVTQYTHDSGGRETSRTEAYGTPYQRKITTVWNTTLNLPEQMTEYDNTNQLVRQTTNCYNSSSGSCSDSTGAGNSWMVSIYDPVTWSTRTTTLSWAPWGLHSLQSSRTNVSEITTWVDYVTQGGSNPCQPSGGGIMLTNALGQIAFAPSFDAHGFPLKICDLNDVATTFTYDSRERVTSKSVGSGVTHYTYDLAGNLTQITLPTGGIINLTYDAAHRLTNVADSTTVNIAYTLDAMGNRTNEQVFDSTGAPVSSHQRVYDNLNRLIQETGGMGQTSTYTYDLDGNRLSTTDPLGHLTSTAFDPLNRIASTIDANGNTTTFNRDSLDHLVDVTDPRGLDTHYSVNAFGNVLESDSPDTGRTTFQYDDGGNLIIRTDSNGNVLSFTYDALDRMTNRFANGNSKYTAYYTYDNPIAGQYNLGRLTEVDAWTGTSTANSVILDYDGNGNVANKQFQINGWFFNVAYGYDAGNDLTSVGLGAGQNPNQSIIYKRDGYGRATEVDVVDAAGDQYAVAKNIKWGAFGPLTKLTYGNGLVETRSYDADYRLGAISIPGTLGLSYVRDADDNITSVTDSVNPNGQSLAQTLTYDAMNRVSTWHGRYSNITSLGFTYDADGNRTSKAANTSFIGTYNYDSASNQLMSITGNSGAATYAYDTAGDVTNDGSYKYTYDPTNRLSVAKTASTGTSVGTYVYDGVGQRVQETANGTTHSFVYDEAGHLQAELNASGTIFEAYVWLGDRPLVVFANSIGAASSARYIHADALNTPRVMTDSTKTVGWVWQSDPFGKGSATVINFGSGVMIRLPGQYYDTETGTHYNYFRHYDPTTGRHMESDPIGLAGGINTYAYVNDNPVAFVDPFGLCPQQPAPVAPETDEQKHADCIRDFLNSTFGPGTADTMYNDSYGGPNGLNNRNETVWEIAAEESVKFLGEAATSAELGPYGEAALVAKDVAGIAQHARATIRANSLYNLANMNCTP
jgi:RHS repeat-associated protein